MPIPSRTAKPEITEDVHNAAKAAATLILRNSGIIGPQDEMSVLNKGLEAALRDQNRAEIGNIIRTTLERQGQNEPTTEARIRTNLVNATRAYSAKVEELVPVEGRKP